MNKAFKIIILFAWLAFITGIIYPLLITAIAQFTMPEMANGSLIFKNGKPIGSKLIAQKFEGTEYFWPRPSTIDYNPLPSSGSNLAPTSKTLKNLIESRKAYLLSSSSAKAPTPGDLLFSSGSGIDPHISMESAYYQIPRVAKGRKMENRQNEIKDLVDQVITYRRFGFLGEPYINVLELNLALDQKFPLTRL